MAGRWALAAWVVAAFRLAAAFALDAVRLRSRWPKYKRTAPPASWRISWTREMLSVSTAPALPKNKNNPMAVSMSQRCFIVILPLFKKLEHPFLCCYCSMKQMFLSRGKFFLSLFWDSLNWRAELPGLIGEERPEGFVKKGFSDREKYAIIIA